MKKRFLVGLAVLLSVTSGLLANGLNLNGFGARATAMGGAFVGLADDFTAVFFNPAGLAQMTKSSFGLSTELLIPKSKYTVGPASIESKSKKYPAGLLGYFQPVGENIVVGIGAYTLSGLGAAWDNASPGIEPILLAGSGLPPSFLTPPGIQAYEWESFIGSVTIAPTIAVKVSEQFYLGASFNINYGFFKMDRWAGVIDLNPPAPDIYFNPGQQTLDVKGWGFGATLGFLVKPADWVSFGGTYRFESKMKMSGTMEMENMGVLGLPTSSGAKMDVASPFWLAGGVALKPVDQLTWTFDVHYTNWAKLTTIGITFDAPQWAALPPGGLMLDWCNKAQIRTGLEYDFGRLAIRGGYYYDPAPAPDETLNILTPSFTFNSIAGGIGYQSGNLKLDFAVEYLMGKDRTVAASGHNLPGTYEMNILVPMLSLSFGW
jgi:long-chain fatty acid transport protein